MARRTSGRVSAFRRTPLFAAIACAFAQGALAGNFSVINSNDFGAGSLRQAIYDANLDCTENSIASSTITFVGGPFVIKPSQPLLALECPGNPVAYNVYIDATTAYGAAPNTDPKGFNAVFGATLDGSTNYYGGTCGLEYIDNGYGGALGVAGMEIINFNYGASGYGLCGRLNAFGNRLANNGNGMRLVDGSMVGNSNPEGRNVIIDSAPYYGWGIELGAGDFSIYNNFIGTSDGVTAAPNDEGIVWTCCNTVTGSIQKNVIASTGYANIDLGGDSFYIRDNMIGADVNGTSMLGSASFGIALYFSYGSSISQNVIAGATLNGIDIYDSSDVDITDNKIGTTADGSAAMPNSIGIYDDGSTNTSIYGNSISGNTNFGIWLTGTNNAFVESNFIGTNYGGTLAVPNQVGVYLGQSPIASFYNNTISGNTDVGFWSSDASNLVLSGNKIGTTADRAGALPNGREGMVAECGSLLRLTGNTIAHNQRAGLSLSAVSSSYFYGNTIMSNGDIEIRSNGIEIGTSDCSSPPQIVNGGLRPKGISVGVPNYSNDNTFELNTIGSNSANGVKLVGGNRNTFDSNIITSNADDGILIESEFAASVVSSPATGNRITKGSNAFNGGKNIDLGAGTPNNRQERPIVRSAVRNTALNTTTVTVELAANVGEYVLELFSNSGPGKPAGEQYLLTSADLNVATAGPVTYAFTVADLTSDNFSATAIHQDTADTSEFADIYTVGVAAVPAAGVLPTSIDFGDVVVGRQSSPGAITVTSQGTAAYVISALRDTSCTGPSICSTGAFVCSTSCVEGTPYATTSSCTINASFAPTVLGAQSKTLALCDNTTSSPRMLTLSGNGVPVPLVDISIAPSAWFFGEVLVNTQSPAKTFRVTNAGSNQVYLGPVKVSGDFKLSGNTCGASLAGAASCTVDVMFAPAVKGLVTGDVSVLGSNAPITAAASRSKVAAAPTTLTASAKLQGSGLQFGDLRLPASLSFGTSTLHGAPVHQTVVLANTGNGPLAIGNISVAGPFTISNGCGASLAPEASCSVTIEFNPAALGSFNGTLTIVSDAPGGARAIPLTAQVIAESRPVVTVSPATIGFGERIAGTETANQRVTITNEGSQDAILGAPVITSDTGAVDFFIRATTCGTTLAAQASCFADVYMKPSGFSERRATLFVPSNSRESPAHVDLGGTGCRPFTAGANRTGSRTNCGP